MPESDFKLTVADHRRDRAGLTYVYPVVSRRAGGVSIGINLNVNRACNWRCIYCQVPDLRRGSAPPVDLEVLGRELRGFLERFLHGPEDAFEVPPGMRRLNDIALSGDGEPTSAAEFEQVVELVGKILDEFGLAGAIKLVLITNGSLISRPAVRRSLKRMAALNGEVWFKLDSATPEGRRRINNTRQSAAAAMENLRRAAELCPVWIQTALFVLDGQPPAAEERRAYMEFLRRCRERGIALRGVMLYALARPSLQPESARLARLPASVFADWAAEIEALGFEAKPSA